jgi:hypothetical protein
MTSRNNSGAGFIATGGFFVSLVVAFFVFHTLQSQLWRVRGLNADSADDIGIGLGIATFIALWAIFLAISLAVWNQAHTRGEDPLG